MKTKLLVILIILVSILSGCSSQNKETTSTSSSSDTSTTSTDTMNVETNENTPDEESFKLNAHYKEAIDSFSSLYPIADTNKNEGLAGTWINCAKEKDLKTTMVLALNSNDTFEFFVEIVASDSSGTAKGNGTYTHTETEIHLDFEPNPDNEDEPTIIENATYSYKIEGDTLYLTNKDGETLEYYRVDTAAV